MSTEPTGKATLRRGLRRRRAALSRGERRDAERRAVSHAAKLMKRGRRVAAYLAAGSELSLAPLIALARRRRVALYFPVVPHFGRKLRFSRLDTPGGRWRRNRYGIDEHHAPHPLGGNRLDLALLPLVGFDASGGRLGQGGGYYDATFAFLRLRSHWRRPRLIGVAFECQRVAHVPLDAHDVRLDGVVTEIGLSRTRP